jgi:hypothetical protein
MRRSAHFAQTALDVLDFYALNTYSRVGKSFSEELNELGIEISHSIWQK